MALEQYKILFYEVGNYLYYITDEKKVVKMREKLRETMTFHRYDVPMTDEDWELLKRFDLDQVYEQKILNFRKIRGVKPVRKVNIAWN